MRTTILLLLFVSMLSGCVAPGGRGGYDEGYYEEGHGYYGPRHQQPPPPPYYNSGPGYDEHRQRRMDANCNMNWQNCAGVCNSMANPQQRAVCVANCNNALNQCKNQ